MCLLSVPLLLGIVSNVWYQAYRNEIYPIGLFTYTTAAVAGTLMFQQHRGDCTEFAPYPYLGYGFAMLASTLGYTLELRYRGCKSRWMSASLWIGLLTYLLKPFTDIAFAGC